jgi:gluconate 2-dehydrogenase subunit 3-like protein
VNRTDDLNIINQITRRQWILRLGETVALAGVSGILPETPLRFFVAQQNYASLPPGLYEPTPDDLVHALSSHKSFVPPAGSETDYVQPGAPSTLQFFSAEDFRTITAFVSILLGDVDPKVVSEAGQWVDLWFHSAEGVLDAMRNLDPLHRTLAAAYFGEASVKEMETADPAAVARQGLVALHQLCEEKYHADFALLTPTQQEEVMRGINAIPSNSSLKKFYELVRNQAIRGYFTSAAGLKELDYKGNAYYPYCPGCESAKGPA